MTWSRRRRRDADFDREIEAHLALEVDRLVADGLSPAEARQMAMRSFGNVLAARERFHETNHWIWLEQLVRDLQYASRGISRRPAFLAATVLPIGVALGLLTTAFAVFNAYVLRPFAVRDPHSLYRVGWRAKEATSRLFRWDDYRDLRERTDVFEAVIAERTRFVPSGSRSIHVAFVSDDYFITLSPRVLIGRGLAGFDARPADGRPVAVLGHAAWTRLFDRASDVIGRPIDLNGQPCTIVGVLSPDFSGLDGSPRDVWLPAAAHTIITKQDLMGSDQPREMRITARLRQGVTATQAQHGVAALVGRMVERADDVQAELRPQATPAAVSLDLLVLLSPVFGAFTLVLVTACANVSNVMLARAHARQREIGVRLSLGASRSRLVRQQLTEGLLLAVLAGLFGIVLAGVLLEAGNSVFVGTLPPSVGALVRVVPLDLDYRVFLFVLAVSTGTTTLFALVPALQGTRLSLTHAVRGLTAATQGSSALRGLLVVSQVAVSLILLVAAATLIRNATLLGATDLGFDPDGVISINQRTSGAPLIAEAASVLTGDQRISELAVTSRNPLFGQLPKAPVPSPHAGVVAASYMHVSPEYFSILRIPILHGRGFLLEEARSEAAVAIVSASGASALWPGTDPLGKTVRIRLAPSNTGGARIDRRPTEDDPGFDVTVVGVARDVVSSFVFEGTDTAHLYLPTSAQGVHAGALLARARSRQDQRPEVYQSLLQRVDQDPLAFESLPLSELLTLQMYPLRAASWVGSLLSAVALALSVSGLYSVLAYTLGQRTREIGIRMALGATARAVVRLVLGQTARLAGLGAAIGLVIAFAVLKVLSAAVPLSNVSMVDAGAFAVGLALVGVATTMAGYGPARRATRLDPAQTLRTDG
jgi:predicted permease